jgi:uncharacterized cupredoxin-like copper-binding protein
VNRIVSGGLAALVAVGATGAGYAVAASGRVGADPLGPGVVRLDATMEYSRFSLPADLTVQQGTLVEFVFTNVDPINHEFVIGDDDVHARHEQGTEAFHPPVPGEVSVGPGERGVTTYLFADPGVVRYVCHLPGHAAYGMEGVVRVVPTDPA